MLRWALRCLLLTGGFALTSFGLLQWQAQGIDVADVWPFGHSIGDAWFSEHAWPRPVQDIVLGVVVISLSLWQMSAAPRDSNDES